MAVRNLNVNNDGIREIERLVQAHQISKKVKRIKMQGVVFGLATVLTVTGMAAAYGRKHPNWPAKPDTAQTMVEEQPNKLHRYYKVKFGDSLASISEKTGVPIATIRQYNGMDSKDSLIYPDQGLDLVYEVKDKNMKYYTKEYNLGGKTLEEIADECETDVNTIRSLNPTIIIRDDENGTDMFLGDAILVPNFITPRELTAAKELDQAEKQK